MSSDNVLRVLLSRGATIALVMACTLISTAAQAQPPAPTPPPAPVSEAESDKAENGEEKKDKDAKKDEEADKDAPKELSKFVEKLERIDGLFPLYRNTNNGKVYLELAADQLDRDFVYMTYTHNGVVDAGHFLGQIRENRLVRFERNYRRVAIVAQNTAYYYDPLSPLSKVSDSNITNAVLASVEIVAETKDKSRFLIEANPLFISDKLPRLKPEDDPDNPHGKGFKLGDVDKDRSRFVSLKNYPKNTDLVVDYVFEVKEGKSTDKAEYITDPRTITVRVQQTFIEAPESDYEPRFDDYRVGFFANRATDLTSTSATPYRDAIERWDLRKKDPSARISDPVKPITFWIENSTPVEFREPIRQGVLRWNEAFEAAGFSNAIEVKIQPDNADWDAGDIRYNVIRFASSPDPFFAGYGPNFSHPRTGEILGADVVLEFIFVTTRLARERAFSEAGLVDASEARLTSLLASRDGRHCAAGSFMQMNTLFGLSMMKAQGASAAEQSKLVEESLYYLALHEVGHTLGLSHNMAATTLHDNKSIHDRELTEKVGLDASVMDYPLVNFAPKGVKQGQYYTTRPGPYDVWAIQYGYTPALSDAKAEEARQAALLNRSTDPSLRFGNDADDMRDPGRGIDPKIMVGDMSSEPIAYAVDRLALVDATMPELLGKFSKDATSFHELRNAYLIMTREQANAAEVVSRYIGGVYVQRAVPSQDGYTRPFTPVPRAEQVQAMQALHNYVFSPLAFRASDELLAHLQMQRRGFDFREDTEDPKLHARILRAQKMALDHLLHPKTLARITDTSLYGNKYPLPEMMRQLTRSIIAADAKKPVTTVRQGLQALYTERLLALLEPDDKGGYQVDAVARAVILDQVKTIRRTMQSGAKGDPATRAHRAHLVFMIDRALDRRS